MYLGCLSRSDLYFTVNCSLMKKGKAGTSNAAPFHGMTLCHTATVLKLIVLASEGMEDESAKSRPATSGKWLFFSSSISPGCHSKAVLLQRYRVLNLNVLCLNSVMQMRTGLYSSLFLFC